MKDLTMLGEVIKDHRLSLNLRMEDVAGKAHISRATLWAIERGDANCSLKSILSVLDILNLSLEIVNNGQTIPNMRSRAPRINTKLDKKINRFIIMCVEQYAKSANLNSGEAYKRMLDNGVINELHDDYEDLHGMSTEYLNEYIDSLLGGTSL